MRKRVTIELHWTVPQVSIGTVELDQWGRVDVQELIRLMHSMGSALVNPSQIYFVIVEDEDTR